MSRAASSIGNLRPLSDETAEKLPFEGVQASPGCRPAACRRKVAAANNLTLIQRLTRMRRIETIGVISPFERDCRGISLSAAYPIWRE